MISWYIIKGNIKAIQQIFKIIGRQVTAGKDQMGSLAFFSEKVVLEERFFNFITNCKNFHEFRLVTHYWLLVTRYLLLRNWFVILNSSMAALMAVLK